MCMLVIRLPTKLTSLGFHPGLILFKLIQAWYKFIKLHFNFNFYLPVPKFLLNQYFEFLRYQIVYYSKVYLIWY